MPLPKIDRRYKGFLGVHDTPPEGEMERYVKQARNAYMSSRANGAFLPRAGFQARGSGTIAGVIQAIGTFTTPLGLVVNVMVGSGEIYSTVADQTTGTTYTKDIATADYAGATGGAVTVKTTGTIYMTPYNGQMVFNDGTNVPFMWDGTNGGGLTKLTNVPAAVKGPPVVYYAKLVWVKSEKCFQV